MHHFPHHIGDYAAATAHLSWDEDLAYTRLLRAYYQHEKPIPADVAQACRLARASTPAQRKAVETVLNEFFALQADGWHQKRCDEEIAEYKTTVERNRANGKKGGRPKTFGEVPRETKPTGNPVGSQVVTVGLAKQNPTESHVGETQTKGNQNQNQNQNQNHNLDEANASSVGEGADTPDDGPDSCPHQAIIAIYHEVLPELRRVAVWNEQRRGYLRKRWREDPQRQNLDFWRRFFQYVRKCPFLLGTKDGCDFEADLEWLVRPQNFVKVIEGRYEEKTDG